MPSLSPRVLSPRVLTASALLVAALAGCHSKRTPEAGRGPAPKPDLSAEDIQRTPTQSVEEMLRGRVSGVTVLPTAGGGIAVLIRGGSSINGDNAPLYVLDGIPFEPGPNGIISGVQPQDIESIRVLKNASETAMYGVRGANGVILIKTKNPRH